jgi:hypothetical protein
MNECNMDDIINALVNVEHQSSDDDIVELGLIEAA